MYSVYLLVKAKFGKKKTVAAKLSKFEEISVLNEVYGSYDLVVRIDSEDSKTMEKFMASSINSISEVQSAETLVVADTDDDYDEERSEESE